MPPVTLVDDLAYAVSLPTPPRRLVSLVPSITEALATTCPDRLVGATDWCTHPEDLAVQRVRGTKNPDLKAIAALGPDLVVANKEENRELDVRRLRDAGVPVWVTDIETVPAALDALKDAAVRGDNVFAVLMEATRVCSLQQITEAFFEVGGQYRRNV